MKNIAFALLAALVISSCSTTSPQVDSPASAAPMDSKAVEATPPIATALDVAPSFAPTCGTSKSKRISFVLHAGVGYTPSHEQSEFVRALVKTSQDSLIAGAAAIEVVQAAVEAMENSGLFNTGKGGVRTSEKTVELDASIMDGNDMSAGAVASLQDVKNPIRLARYVKEKTPHLLMVGPGASALASRAGFEKVTPDYFISKLERVQNEQKGTVGSVAIDRCADIASATSTGGLTGKLPGRVGDSPIIGAGTYANNEACGVSATGDGEKFIRASVAARICFGVQYLKKDLKLRLTTL